MKPRRLSIASVAWRRYFGVAFVNPSGTTAGLGGKANVRYPFEAQPYTYWFRKTEFEQAVTEAGFELLDTATSRSLLEGGDRFVFGGMLYAVARKPEGVK